MKSYAPYQLFFPIGILSSLLAVGVWLVQDLQLFGVPVMLIHSKLILGGFLWSFIVGFLMTAVPKMTGTKAASKVEVGLGLLFIGAQIFCSWLLDGRWFYGFSALTTAFVLVFALRRVLKSQREIPVFFSHVGLGLSLSLLGAICYFQQNKGMGFHLYHVGTILLLVLGIGTRFFSFLSGLPSNFESAPRPWPVLFHFFGVTVAALLVIAGSGLTWGYLGLSVLALIYLLFVWGIFRKSTRPSPLKWGMRMVALMIPLSFFMSWVQPQLAVAWLHLLFIGCFGIVTYAVATRVILAHGSYSTDLELKTPVLWIFIAFFAGALAVRILYSLSDGPLKMTYLKVAAGFWLFAVLCWCYSFARKIFVAGEQSRPSC